MKYIPTIATCPEWYKIHQGMCIRCYEPQPSSIPVEELPSMYYGNEKHPDIESIRKAHPEAFDTSKNYETSPSTPEVSWKDKLIEMYLDSSTHADYEAFIEQLLAEATLTERKRVNDILDGMKKEGDDFQCFDTDCFGNRTPTVIEKRLSSQDESYNLALEQAKHLINNTQ